MLSSYFPRFLIFQISVASTWTVEDFKSSIEPSSGSFSISDINFQVPSFCCSLFCPFFIFALASRRHVLETQKKTKAVEMVPPSCIEIQLTFHESPGNLHLGSLVHAQVTTSNKTFSKLIKFASLSFSTHPIHP